MKISSAIAFAACLLTTSFASAASGTPPVEADDPVEARPAAAQAEAAPEPRLICRLEKQTGSQRATRICRSPERLERDRNDAARQIGSQGTPPPPRER